LPIPKKKLRYNSVYSVTTPFRIVFAPLALFRGEDVFGFPIAHLNLEAFTGRVQFEFLFNRPKRLDTGGKLVVGGREVALVFVRNRRARRYVMRLRPDGSARVTIPRGGCNAEARRFVERSKQWLQRQFERRAAAPIRPTQWFIGSEILFRGEPTTLTTEPLSPVAADVSPLHNTKVEGELTYLGSESIRVDDIASDLRRPIEMHLWKLATKELPRRVLELATAHGFEARRVTVRNQRSRWGSCSPARTISLNWRLIQTPSLVSDYIILHELCHLRHMNHSRRFWREVECVCPEFQTAERWLKQHSFLLG
jgi:predicted metal-dependent hydrolase